MSILKPFSTPKAPPQLNPQLAAALRVPLERLKRGEAGLRLDELAHALDQFKGFPVEELRQARQLIIDADPAAIALFHGTDNDPTRGAATAERIIALLSGEAHGLAHLPSSAADASKALAASSTRAWAADEAALGAEKKLEALVERPAVLTEAQQNDFESLFAAARRDDERDRLAQTAINLGNLRPGGAAVMSPRLAAMIAEPFGEGRPTLSDSIAALLSKTPKLEARDVPVVLDRLFDLNPFELKTLRRALAPTKDLDSRYAQLGAKNPLNGLATPDKIIQMLGGIGFGHPALPTTPDEATTAGLPELAKALNEISRPTAAQQRSWIVEVSARSGIKGVFSFGFEEIFARSPEDRHTHKRHWEPSNQLFLRTATSLNSVTWSKRFKAQREYGVNIPYLYGSVGNPVLGARAGIYIPLVANATVSANGTLGLGIVLNTPILLLHVGLNAYITDPRLLKYIDPALEALGRVTAKVKPLLSPAIDAWENLVHKVKRPVEAPTVDWSQASVSRATIVEDGETVTVSGPTDVQLGERRVELSLAPGVTRPMNVQLHEGTQGLELLLDGKRHALPSTDGKTRILVSARMLWVELESDGPPRGLKVER